MIFHKWVKTREYVKDYTHVCTYRLYKYMFVPGWNVCGKPDVVGNTALCKEHTKEFWRLEETILLKFLKYPFQYKPKSDKTVEISTPAPPAYEIGQWMTIKHNDFMTDKPILYIDMDGPLVNFEFGVAHCTSFEDKERTMNCEGFFLGLPPTEGALEACEWLIQHFECFILTSTAWDNPFSGMEKRLWVDMHLPKYFYKRLITSHFKNLNIGNYLIDDRTKNGAGEFSGELIQFGTVKFKGWKEVIEYLKGKI